MMDDAATPTGHDTTHHEPPAARAKTGHGGHGHDGHDGHDHGHGHDHHHLGWWRTYWFSTDHKTIGIQYLITGLVFLLIGFILMLLMRWQIAYPGQPLTVDRFFANVAISADNGANYLVHALTGVEFTPRPFAPVNVEPSAEEKQFDALRVALAGRLEEGNPRATGQALDAAAAALDAARAWTSSAKGEAAKAEAADAVKIAEQEFNAASEANKAAVARIRQAFDQWKAGASGDEIHAALARKAEPYANELASGDLSIGLFLNHLSQLKYSSPPLAERLFGRVTMPGAVMSPDFYNSLGAMHGTIMVFLAIVPLGFAAFGNFVMPLQIGAPDMTFPRLNMLSYHFYFWGGLVAFGSFFVPGGAAKSGWTSYSPLASTSDQPATFAGLYGDPAASAWPMALTGQSLWLIAMIILITSSLLGAVNFIATIIQLRCKGMQWMRLPFFVWAQFVTAFLLLLAFPPLEAACVMQLMDRVADTSFFLPTGLVVSGLPQMSEISGGGAPLLWQHLFWFLAHPEVYVLILPAIGIVAEIIACHTRKPLWGYRSLVYSIFVLGFLSFIVWAHHMYLTGMGTVVSTFFQTTTIIISIPSVIILTALLISLWGGSIRFPTSMLFATAFLPMFGIGGLTGIPLAFNAADLYLHDTYYVIAHFHYIVAPGTIFGLFAGVYHWFPKATGRRMSEFWGKVHFWPSFILMNFIFMPMFLQGMAGMHRRWYDGGASWDLAKDVVAWNQLISISAFLLFVVQIPFIVNFFWSIWFGERVGDNPWRATTLEWSTPTPPGHGNFEVQPVVDKGPYEYSVPGAPKDYSPQNVNAPDADALPAGRRPIAAH